MKQKEPFEIIKADASHIEFLSSFGRESFINAYRSTLPLKELAAYTEATFKPSVIRNEIERAKAMYFICQDSKSKPCGYSKLLPSIPPTCIARDGSIELQRLYVDKNHTAKGLGRLLSLHGESAAIHQEFRTIWLRVWEGNVLAQRIYLKWNYKVHDTETYHVGRESRTVVLMRKTLGNEPEPLVSTN